MSFQDISLSKLFDVQMSGPRRPCAGNRCSTSGR